MEIHTIKIGDKIEYQYRDLEKGLIKGSGTVIDIEWCPVDTCPEKSYEEITLIDDITKEDINVWNTDVIRKIS